MQPRMGGIIHANIPDIETLYASYMPYVVGGRRCDLDQTAG